MEDWRIIQSAKVVQNTDNPCKTGILVGDKIYPIERDHVHYNGITAAVNITLKNSWKIDGPAHNLSKYFDLTGDTLTGKLLKGQVLIIDGKKYTVTEDTYNAAANVIIGAYVTPTPDYEVPAGTPVEILVGTKYV